MIEAEIEKRIADKLRDVLETIGLDGIQVVTSFEVTDFDQMKAVEETGKDSILVVKASPRAYQSPTIPTCQIDCVVSLTVRADMDIHGQRYMDFCDALMNKYQSWQACWDEAHDDFDFDDIGFDFTGFLLGAGTTGLDAATTTFQYTHNMTIYGVVR